MVLGKAASIAVAERNSGIYRGLIIGHTRDYIIQQIGRKAAAVIHAKDQFETRDHAFPWPEVGRVYWVQKKLASNKTSRPTTTAGQLYPPRYPGFGGF